MELERAGVALATIVALGSGPVFAGVLDAAWFHRRPSAVWVQATAVAVTGGVVLVAAQGGTATLDAVGIVCALAAGASYALYAVAIKSLIEGGVGSTVAMAGAFTVGAVLLVPLGMAAAGLSVGTGRHAYQTAGGQLLVTVGLALVIGCWVWAGRIMRLPDDDRVFDR